MPMYVLPDLPYAHDALAPAISEQTLHFHHDKHHASYLKKTNDLAGKAGLDHMALEDLICEARQRKDQSLFNNAAQAWNHAFFWESMAPPHRHSAPSQAMRKAIDEAFGDLNGL